VAISGVIYNETWGLPRLRLTTMTMVYSLDSRLRGNDTEGGRKKREEKVCAGEHPQTTSRKYPAPLSIAALRLPRLRLAMTNCPFPNRPPSKVFLVDIPRLPPEGVPLGVTLFQRSPGIHRCRAFTPFFTGSNSAIFSAVSRHSSMSSLHSVLHRKQLCHLR